MHKAAFVLLLVTSVVSQKTQHLHDSEGKQVPLSESSQLERVYSSALGKAYLEASYNSAEMNQRMTLKKMTHAS